MPPSFAVQLVPHDPAWAGRAEAEGQRLRAAVPALLAIHHIGSTAIPGIAAKPILDLLAEASDLAELDASRASLATMGYQWRGEYGLTGRRYCTKDDPVSGERRVQLHCFTKDTHDIARHLAFRDCLRPDPQLAAEYGQIKLRCAARHAHDSRAYADCKDGWIKRVEAQALLLRPPANGLKA